jgi:hypothetical protein
MNTIMSLFSTICHHLPPFATLCHCLPLFVTLCHSLPLFVTLCHSLSLFATFNCGLRGIVCNIYHFTWHIIFCATSQSIWVLCSILIVSYCVCICIFWLILFQRRKDSLSNRVENNGNTEWHRNNGSRMLWCNFIN